VGSRPGTCPASSPKLGAVPDVPETRYAKTADGADIAYQVVSEGRIHVLIGGSITDHVEHLTGAFFGRERVTRIELAISSRESGRGAGGQQ